MTSERSNAASERALSIVSTWADWETLTANWDRWYTEDFVRDDRRRLINMPLADRSTYLEHSRIWFEIADGKPECFISQVLAVREQRLCAWIVEAPYRAAPSVHAVIVTQFDENVDRIEKQVHFDLEDVGDAIAALDAMQTAVDPSETDQRCLQGPLRDTLVRRHWFRSACPVRIPIWSPRDTAEPAYGGTPTERWTAPYGTR